MRSIFLNQKAEHNRIEHLHFRREHLTSELEIDARFEKARYLKILRVNPIFGEVALSLQSQSLKDIKVPRGL